MTGCAGWPCRLSPTVGVWFPGGAPAGLSLSTPESLRERGAGTLLRFRGQKPPSADISGMEISPIRRTKRAGPAPGAALRPRGLGSEAARFPEKCPLIFSRSGPVGGARRSSAGAGAEKRFVETSGVTLVQVFYDVARGPRASVPMLCAVARGSRPLVPVLCAVARGPRSLSQCLAAWRAVFCRLPEGFAAWRAVFCRLPEGFAAWRAVFWHLPEHSAAWRAEF